MIFPKPQPELSPQQKLAKAQANADHWGAIAADPDLSPEAAAWAFNLATQREGQRNPTAEGAPGAKPAAGRSDVAEPAKSPRPDSLPATVFDPTIPE